MSSKCTIQFDNNPFGIYYAGQVISGTAELVTTRPKTIRSIVITVSGFAEVRWTECITRRDQQGRSVQTPETYSASDLYYNSEEFVYGQSGGSQLELPAGKYVFPFKGTIPPNAPTSLNGSFGQIQHEVSLVVDRVMRYNNIFKQTYTVISPFDLNLNPTHAKPLHKIEEKTFCWSLWCGRKNPMIMSVKVPFRAYAPGQKVDFNVILDNQSDVNCSEIKVRLMKKVSYASRNPETKTKEVLSKVADCHLRYVSLRQKGQFNDFLQIPSTTPSSLKSCSLIEVSYTLKFIAKTSRLHGDLVVEFPFTIGTVPLYASINGEGATTTQTGGDPIYKPIPQPRYEEHTQSEQFENNTFKPRYPLFLTPRRLSTNDSSGQSSSAAKQGQNIYPKPNISSGIPTPTAPPSSPPEKQPLLPPVASSQQPNTAKAGPNKQQPLEVLGFSLPPDYKPTPNESNVATD